MLGVVITLIPEVDAHCTHEIIYPRCFYYLGVLNFTYTAITRHFHKKVYPPQVDLSYDLTKIDQKHAFTLHSQY